MKYVGYSLLAIIIVWYLYKMFVSVSGLKTVNAEKFAEMSKGQLIIDVRETSEYKQGHIAKAVNNPLSQLNSRWSEIPNNQPVYLYCQSGMRSKQAAGILAKNGFKDITHLAGGIRSWNGNLVK